ncbi:hypothetical protein V9L05_15330 [Bernardetia sp. Wsw4-3y2]|uniref:hypothetical protein n=1 Tax=Bernardetia sp. Wsw4-3y2 TaxID=3127471 RepID=UPI0030D113E0
MVEEYINYFEWIARNLKAISHNPEEKRTRFVTGNIDELLGGLRSKLDTKEPCLILYNFEAGFEEAPDEAKTLNMQAGFAVIQNVKENDFREQDRKSDALFEICADILSKILYDREMHDTGELCPAFISDFDLNTVKAPYIGRLGDNAYGWFVEFDIKSDANSLLKYNPSKWT